MVVRMQELYTAILVWVVWGLPQKQIFRLCFYVKFILIKKKALYAYSIFVA